MHTDPIVTARNALAAARTSGVSQVALSMETLDALLAALPAEEPFWRLTEHNDYEGETWHFYVRVAGNEDAIAFLEAELDKRDDDDARSDFPYRHRTIQSSIDAIGMMPDDTGYMGTHNLVPGRLDLERLRAADWNDDPLYKGGLCKFAATGSEVGS